MAGTHDYTGFAIENILHPIIEAIEQEKGTVKEKEALKQQAFQRFLEEAKQYEECPGFQNMTVEQLQMEYERLMKQQKQEER